MMIPKQTKLGLFFCFAYSSVMEGDNAFGEND